MKKGWTLKALRSCGVYLNRFLFDPSAGCLVMFPPPWAGISEETEDVNVVAMTRKFKNVEEKQGEIAPGRLRRLRSRQGCRRPRVRVVPRHGDPLDGNAHGKQSSANVLFHTTLEGAPTYEGTFAPQVIQKARDDCLATPKHSTKYSTATHEGCRLFGQAALLPLKSQARARARSEATTSARSGIRRTNSSFDVRGRKTQGKFHSRTGGMCRSASGRMVVGGMIAWGDESEGLPMLELVRQTINARRPPEKLEGRNGTEDLGRAPNLEPEPSDAVDEERRDSEDTMSTQALLCGTGCRGETLTWRDSGYCTSRQSPNVDAEGYNCQARRRDFFSKFHLVEYRKQSHPHSNVTTAEEESVRAMVPMSPSDESTTDRVSEATDKFLRQLSDHGRAPWPAILKLSGNTRAIEVGGMGLGDEIVTALAAVLPILWNIERLVVFDNRTSDLGTHAVVKAVQSLPCLTFLDLSENEVGPMAAHELREYMRNTWCKLRFLAIRKADIDDDECREFMAALGRNSSLRHVDLSNNLIGKSETLKVTGAGSIAAMLGTTSTLRSLDLSWNSLRMNSAVTVARSLRCNHSLESLCLGYNSFSDYASQELAVSLFENDTLTSLDLSYNSVTPSAAMVLAFALKVNTTMSFVQLAGNRIGQNGGEALALAMRTSTRRDGSLVVGMMDCDTSRKDNKLFNIANATGEYDLDLQIPYHKVVASELLRLANCKPTAHLKVRLGRKGMSVKLHRKGKAVSSSDPRAHVTRRIEGLLAKGRSIEEEIFVEYAQALGMTPQANTACKMVHSWNTALSRQSKLVDNENGGCCDFTASSFFEALFVFADRDDKGELVVDDLVMLFQTLQLPYGEARMRHVMCKYDTDHSGSIDLEEFTHYMAAAHIKQPLVQHSTLCTEDGNEWQIPRTGILRIQFVQEPSFERTLGEICTDSGVDSLITNIRQSPTDDMRKRLFELATASCGIYFTSYQAQGVLEAVSGIFTTLDAVAILMPQLASSHECTAFIDSNLDHDAKFKLRFMIGGAWGAMVGMPSGHFSLDMQNNKDRLAAEKMAALANYERQFNKVNGRANTSQHGNWQNFRNAEYNDEPVILTSAWFIDLPNSGILRFDYISTSSPDHHLAPLTMRRFQKMLKRLRVSKPITCATPIDDDVISVEALHDACASHYRKMAFSSPLYKIDMRDYYRSGSSLDDVSLASWWSAVDVTNMNVKKKGSFAHLVPSDTYVRSWYKLKELEVALCSACLTTDQLARILENFPHEDQLRAQVVTTFYHKVTDVHHMCHLVDALRPDEKREVIARRGYLNVVSPLFADRYYHLNLAVWDEREMAKILVHLAMMEPGENWLDETYARNAENGALPGWELPLDWTKDDGPRNVGILTLWYSSSVHRGCAPNLAVRQDLETRTLTGRAGTIFSSSAEDTPVDILSYTYEWQKRLSILDKVRQKGKLLLTDEVAQGFESTWPSRNDESTVNEESIHIGEHTAPSSITELSEERRLD